MFKTIYEPVLKSPKLNSTPMHQEPHIWQDPDTPTLDIEAGSVLHEHLRGEIIFEKGVLSVRCADGRYSVWIGERLQLVTDDKRLVDKFIDALSHRETRP
jgi:hypothetical protein